MRSHQGPEVWGEEGESGCWSGLAESRPCCVPLGLEMKSFPDLETEICWGNDTRDIKTNRDK